jgi:hypothetical protein
MKALFPILAVLILTSCKTNYVTHERDFKPSTRKGPWTDYYSTIKRGEKPEAPKEQK